MCWCTAGNEEYLSLEVRHHMSSILHMIIILPFTRGVRGAFVVLHNNKRCKRSASNILFGL